MRFRGFSWPVDKTQSTPEGLRVFFDAGVVFHVVKTFVTECKSDKKSLAVRCRLVGQERVVRFNTLFLLIYFFHIFSVFFAVFFLLLKKEATPLKESTKNNLNGRR